jgi:hypothetical protein
MDIYILLIGLTVLGCFIFLKNHFVQKKKKDFGRQGELIVDRKLRFWLGWSGAKVYDDVTFMTLSGNSTQIDHIVISRKGIFCIETKNLNGLLKGNVQDQNWTHINGKGKKNIIYNPIFQNHSHIKHLSKVLNLSNSDIDGFVTNVGDAKLKGDISPLIGKAAIEKGTSFIVKLWFRSNGKYSKDEVKHYVNLLDEKIKEVEVGIDGKHIDYVRKMKGNSPLNLLLNYLYFVIIVLIVFIFYKMFYQ